MSGTSDASEGSTVTSAPDVREGSLDDSLLGAARAPTKRMAELQCPPSPATYGELEISAIPEPYGHSTAESKIERYWQSCHGPVALHRRRVMKYDPRASMTYSPMEYGMQRFSIAEDIPDDDWIATAFSEFVRAEFSDRAQPRTQTAFLPRVSGQRSVPDHFLDSLLAASDGVSDIKIQSKSSHEPAVMAESIFELLCHQSVGSKLNAKHNSRDTFVAGIVPTIQANSRLLFVLPGFPFKDQNRFRVPFGGDVPDMAELSLMIRLHRLTQALYQVHPFGADVVVLSDGELYREIFGISKGTISTYMRRLLAYRNRLNLQGTISFLSLKELVDRAPRAASGESVGWATVRAVRSRLEVLVKKSDSLSATFRVLVSGMKWNAESRERLQGLDEHVCWELLRGDGTDLSAEHLQRWQELEAVAINAALEYASMNLMLRRLDLIAHFFPGAIRGTVHPKPGQFALARSAGAYAWNGVAWSRDWPTSIDDIAVQPFYALADQGAVTQVNFESTGLPCFFTRTQNG